MGQATSAFALQNAMTLGANAGAVLTAAPTTVLSPLNYTINNVRPFDIEVATAVDFVGLIYLLILAFIAAVRVRSRWSGYSADRWAAGELHGTDDGDAARVAAAAQAPAHLPTGRALCRLLLPLS
jgi:hypothetical protein